MSNFTTLLMTFVSFFVFLHTTKSYLHKKIVDFYCQKKVYLSLCCLFYKTIEILDSDL